MPGKLSAFTPLKMGMKIMIMIGLIDWIWLGSHSKPRKLRSIRSACCTHALPVWSNSAQNIATKA